MDPALPPVAIVVLNWNGWPYTAACLESLRRITYPAVRVIVVDNASSGDDMARLSRQEPGMTLIANSTNLGFAGGNNAGIRHALQDAATAYVAVLNNDTVVKPDFLTEMVRAARTRQADMVSPVVLSASDRSTVDRLGLVLTKAFLPFNMTLWEGREPFCPSGCAALYSRRLLESTALNGEYFDEDFFAYSEDLDLGIRAVLQRYRSVLAHDAIVYHHGGAASPPGSDFPMRLRHRNTIWCLLKTVPGSVLLRHLGWIIAAQVLSLMRAAGRGQGGAVLDAKAAGLRGWAVMLRKRRAILRRGVDANALDGALDPRPFYRS